MDIFVKKNMFLQQMVDSDTCPSCVDISTSAQESINWKTVLFLITLVGIVVFFLMNSKIFNEA